jgi:hypothetical protein
MRDAFMIVAAAALASVVAGCGSSGGVPTPVRDYTRGTGVDVHSCTKYDGDLRDSLDEPLRGGGQGYKCTAGKSGFGTSDDWYYFVDDDGTVYEASLGGTDSSYEGSPSRKQRPHRKPEQLQKVALGQRCVEEWNNGTDTTFGPTTPDLHDFAAAVGYGVGGSADVELLDDGVTCQVELQRRPGEGDIVVFQKTMDEDVWHDVENVTLSPSATRAFAKANASYDGNGYLELRRSNHTAPSGADTRPQTGDTRDASYRKGFECATRGAARLRAEGKTTYDVGEADLCYRRGTGAEVQSWNRGVSDGYRTGGVLGP